MNNKVPLFQFQKIYYLLIVGMASTVIFLLSAVPNPSYAQSGKRICMSADGTKVFKIKKGKTQQTICTSVSGVHPSGFGNPPNNAFGVWGYRGRYMTCEAFKKNFLPNRTAGNPCLKMPKTVKLNIGSYFNSYTPSKQNIYHVWLGDAWKVSSNGVGSKL